MSIIIFNKFYPCSVYNCKGFFQYLILTFLFYLCANRTLLYNRLTNNRKIIAGLYFTPSRTSHRSGYLQLSKVYPTQAWRTSSPQCLHQQLFCVGYETLRFPNSKSFPLSHYNLSQIGKRLAPGVQLHLLRLAGIAFSHIFISEIFQTLISF